MNIPTAYRHWVAGTSVALAGVGLTRILAPALHGGLAAAAAVTGQLLALAGLLLIALGVRQRFRQSQAEVCGDQSDQK